MGLPDIWTIFILSLQAQKAKNNKHKNKNGIQDECKRRHE